MKILGIDYGTKRIGLALSDESESLAFPKSIVASGMAGLSKIMDIVTTEKVGKIVIGNSLDQSGERNVVMNHVDLFVTELKSRSGLPVELQDERFTSAFAKSLDFEKAGFNVAQKKSRLSTPDHIDDRAAAIMLQRYLDKNN